MIRKCINRFVERIQMTSHIWLDDNVCVCAANTKQDSNGKYKRTGSVCCIIQVDAEVRKPFCETAVELLEEALNKQH